MNRCLRVLCASLSMSVLLACSSKLKIQSEPSEAEVFVSQQESSERKSLGKTPLELTYKDFSEKAGGTPTSGEFWVLQFELKDYETEKLLLPSQPFGTTLTQVSAKLIHAKEASEAKDILQRLHNAQKFAYSSQFERALVEVDKVLEIDPKFARALSLKGSIFYLQKKYDEAITWFEKSLSADPSFDEALRMINKIKAEKQK